MRLHFRAAGCCAAAIESRLPLGWMGGLAVHVGGSSGTAAPLYPRCYVGRWGVGGGDKRRPWAGGGKWAVSAMEWMKLRFWNVMEGEELMKRWFVHGGGRQQLFMKTMRNERLGRKRKSRLRAGGQMRVNKRAKT